MHSFNYMPNGEKQYARVQHPQQFAMQVPNQNLIIPQYYQEGLPQNCQPIFLEPLPPVYVKNQLLPPPVMMQMPTTVVVQNESQPPMVLNQPPSNIVVKNNAPTPVFVKQTNPNVVVKNEAPQNYGPGIDSCHETLVGDNVNRQVMTNVNRNYM